MDNLTKAVLDAVETTQRLKVELNGVVEVERLDPFMDHLLEALATLSPADAVRVAPAYTKVEFRLTDVNARDLTFEGMVRDIPGRFPRRITNLTTGTEFFVDEGTELELTIMEVGR